MGFGIQGAEFTQKFTSDDILARFVVSEALLVASFSPSAVNLVSGLGFSV